MNAINIVCICQNTKIFKEGVVKATLGCQSVQKYEKG